MSRFTARRLSLGALLLAVAVAASADDAAQRAGKARTVQEALALLGVASPDVGRKVLLEVPDLVVKGRKARIKVSSQTPGTDWIAVLAQPRDLAFIESREFPPGADHSLEVSVDFERTSVVHALVRAGGKYYLVKREVKVVVEEKKPHGR